VHLLPSGHICNLFCVIFLVVDEFFVCLAVIYYYSFFFPLLLLLFCLVYCPIVVIISCAEFDVDGSLLTVLIIIFDGS